MDKDRLEYKIGKNASDNTMLVVSSTPYDVWFHIHNETSAHLVYYNPDKLSLETLRSNGTIYRMAIALKKQSKYRKYLNISVLYCYIKDVTTTNTPGLVTTINTKTILA
jgi:predicted ribosome quality control (RQC) complex YloA/Tae2 family protein